MLTRDNADATDRRPTMLTTVELIVGDVVKESLSVAVPTAPTVKFFGRENAPKLYHDCDGRRHRLSPAEIARHSTGVDRTTGQRTLGIGVESRGNEMVRFDCDAWKLDRDFSDIAQQWLLDYWHRQNRRTPAHLLKKMEHYFGPTHFRFDALPGQVEDWREFLTTVLTDGDSYTPLEVPDCGREQ